MRNFVRSVSDSAGDGEHFRRRGCKPICFIIRALAGKFNGSLQDTPSLRSDRKLSLQRYVLSSNLKADVTIVEVSFCIRQIWQQDIITLDIETIVWSFKKSAISLVEQQHSVVKHNDWHRSV